MANIFQRIGGAIGGLVGRVREAVDVDYRQERAREAAQERAERVAEQAQERAREAAQWRAEQAQREEARQAAAAREQALREEAQREWSRLQFEKALQQDRAAREEERRQREEALLRGIEQAKRDAAAQQAQGQAQRGTGADLLSQFPKIQGIGPKGSLGTIYTQVGANEAMRRIGEAADAARRVSLRVMRTDGTWREMFIEKNRKNGRGIQARQLQNLVNRYGGGDLGAWIAGGCTGIQGDYEDDILDDAIGFQVVEYY